MKKLKVSPFAALDIQESLAYYGDQQPGLEDDFFNAINNVFERIREKPQQFPKTYKTLRKAVVTRFPYVVFFLVDDDICYLLAVFHTSRNPEHMKGRYKKS